MRKLRLGIVAGLLASLTLAGTACSPTPPAASDIVGTAVYNAEIQLLNTILDDLTCNGRPWITCFTAGIGNYA